MKVTALLLLGDGQDT